MKTPFPVYYSEIHQCAVMDVPKDLSDEFWQAQGCRWCAPPSGVTDSGLYFGDENALSHLPPPVVASEPARDTIAYGGDLIREFCEWYYVRLQ